MSYFIQPIVTNKAVTEVSQAVANRETITFTRVALGSGRHRTGAETKNDIVQIVHTLPVTQSMSTDNADTIRILARLDNENVNQELSVNEIGVFAKRANNPEFLFMYTWAEQGDVIPPRSQSAVYRDYDFNTTISKNQQITIQYNPNASVFAKVSELNAAKNELKNNIDTHKRDTNVHLQTGEREKWNGKADRSHRHQVSDIDGLAEKIDAVTVKKANQSDFTAHINNQNNPHNVTKVQIGLSNVDNVKQATYTDHEATKRDVNEQEQRLALLEEMVLQNKYYVPLKAEDNTNTFLVDEHNNLVVADWQYDVKER
jgi:phage-like element PBSX protein xkdV|uniref:Tail-collar fiber protein n=1 Tax=Siphoviridae sp. ctFNZ2 TaxID=2823572 RepID=A0A8S5LAN6_9CAUD|nr:MAG TPA: tail-collar fiber protein [Siphoviridae sp. ctFNZ2]DAR44853.1 MAG TPA: tail-collar fiber protein [Caudoviricetes sp.]